MVVLWDGMFFMSEVSLQRVGLGVEKLLKLKAFQFESRRLGPNVYLSCRAQVDRVMDGAWVSHAYGRP